VDGHFLQKPVDELFRNSELLTLPFMTGVNNDEGGWLIGNVSVNAKSISTWLAHFLQPENAHFKKLVVEEYVGTGEDRLKNRESFTQVLGDLMFVVPAIKAANAHRDAGAPVYLYEYQHPPKFLQDKRPSFVKSDHGDEIFMVFGFSFYPILVIRDVCSEEEEQLSRTMMSYWGNFAYTGSPNGRGLVHWPKYGAKEEYLEIRSTEQVVSQGLKKDRFALLTQTLPETHGQTTDKEHSEL
uniref:Carboxylesterase type B domain-containing protein n=1 Tax=Mola mola TaxID=94237 RepID=A0A3Q3WX20_MOLML